VSRARRLSVVALALLESSCVTEAWRVGGRLPSSTTSELAEPIDFELSVQRAGGDVEAGEWVVEMQSNLAGSPRRGRSQFALRARAEVQSWLNEEAKQTVYRSLRCLVRTGTVSIRADADTPAAVVLELIDAISEANLHRVDLVVAPFAGEKSPGRLPVPFAVEDWNIPEVLWVTAEDSVGNGPPRFGLRESHGIPGENYAELDMWALREGADSGERAPLVAPPVSRGAIVGLGPLHDFIRDWSAAKRHHGFEPPQGVVRCDGVDLQTMIDIVDAFRAAGIRQVSFERRVPRGDRLVY